MDFGSTNVAAWKEALSSYDATLQSLSQKKTDLLLLDSFYRTQLPHLLCQRRPDPFLTQPELHRLMQWKLSRGKWRPRLLDFVALLDGAAVESASRRAFAALPDLAAAISALASLKGVGPATASAVLAAYAPDVAPFMSDEAMVAAVGNAKDYTLKQYLLFAGKLQKKAKELSAESEVFTPSDVERALWSSAIASKLNSSLSDDGPEASTKKSVKRKRKS